MSENKFLIGCCYYPEHWDECYMERDIEKIASLGFNCIRMGEFGWSIYERVEGKFDFSLLARAVAASEIPVISAVGHETDVTLCDFVADLRAPTPSAAAELAVPDRTELTRSLEASARAMAATLTARLSLARRTLTALGGSRVLASPLNYIEDRRMQLGYLTERQERAGESLLSTNRHRFAALCGKLDTLNPLAVLSRGYAAVTDGRGRHVTSVDLVEEGADIHIRFADGTAKATVTEKVRKHEGTEI